MAAKHSQSGFALAATIFALVCLGVLATGGFYLARQETRVGVASERATSAFYLAEAGANEVMSEWDMALFGALPVWGSSTVNGTSADGIWSVNVTRMTDRLYFLGATGGVTQGSGVYGQAGRMLGIVARLYTTEIDAPAAFSTRDKVNFVGKATVKGLDGNPPGWDKHCPGEFTNKPGLLTDDEDALAFKDKNFDATGEPMAILEDPDLLDELFEAFDNGEWEDLTSMASIVVPPMNFNSIGPTLNADGTCNVSNVQNWGDPLDEDSPCFNHFPIIHVKGAGYSKINGGGYGQGILLVDDNIWAGGGFEFYGLIIVRGMFETGGSGPRVYGGVMSENAAFREQTLTGGSYLQYSSCSLSRAVENNPNLTRVRPIENRSWVDLSSVVGG